MQDGDEDGVFAAAELLDGDDVRGEEYPAKQRERIGHRESGESLSNVSPLLHFAKGDEADAGNAEDGSREVVDVGTHAVHGPR